MKRALGGIAFCSLLLALIADQWAAVSLYPQRDSERKRFEYWQKLDDSGEVMPAKEGPWRCVVDQRTGLVWENKNNNEGIHHGDWTYSWYDREAWGKHPSAPRYPEGSCTGLDHCNSAALVAAANRQHWCGFSDWRVPELAELQTLLDTSYPQPGPLVCPCFLGHTARSSYWSNSTDRYRRRQGLNFQTGEVTTFPEHAALFLRLVRGPKLTSDSGTAPE